MGIPMDSGATSQRQESLMNLQLSSEKTMSCLRRSTLQ